MQPIRTKWHRLNPLIDAESVYLTAPKGGLSQPFTGHREELKEFLGQLGKLPKFVVAPELVDIANDADFRRSLLDMKRAGVMRLPFPAMVVEYPREGGHMIIVLRDLKAGGTNSWEDPSFVGGGQDLYGLAFRIHQDKKGEYLVVPGSASHMSIEDRGGEPWIRFAAGTAFLPITDPAHSYLVQNTYLKDSADVFWAACAAYLLMSTRGVEKEVIDTTRINKKRLLSNREPIPRHTYIHIGRVYRSASSDQSDEYLPRRSPRPHWRRGHAKAVRYGPGREKVKEVYIQPKLVAFVGEVEPAAPEYTVSR